MKANICKKTLLLLLALVAMAFFMCSCATVEKTEEDSQNTESANVTEDTGETEDTGLTGGMNVIEDATILTLSDETNVKTIYTTEFQDSIYNQIQDLKRSDYTFASPLIIANPYCTNTTSLYVYFCTDTPVEISYTISTDGYSDFSYTTSGGYATEHEYQLIGLVGGCVNTVTLTATDENGNTESTQWTYEAPEIQNQDEYIQLDLTDGTSTQEVSDGLYTVLGNDQDMDEGADEDAAYRYIYIYDSDGVCRSEIPVMSYRAHRLIFENGIMYYSASARYFVGMDATGHISEIYDLGDYRLHHDYIFGTEGNVLLLGTEYGADTEEDRVLSLDLETGEVTEIIDLRDLFADYLALLDYSEGDTLDWMHLNTLSLVDDDSLILSARETSTIMRIDNIYDNPTVAWIIGSDTFWEGTGYEDLLLDQIGEFSLQAGQHCVEVVEDESLEEGQYYLYMFNNNFTKCSSRGYDYSQDDNYYGTYSAVSESDAESYVYVYLIDETEGTFELACSLPVAYSAYVSSVQLLDNGNILVDSGFSFTAAEYDSDGELIQSLNGTGDKWWYRVLKYDYSGFWFK
ncbi:MAG: aryl-sulfate sulfotransferase [Clostridiales bacterium]|nr:aryl-sulfate sulfotransferase [Clostridiales bacterium]